MAPDGISGDVGVDCPGEAEPFVDEVGEGVEFRRIRCDFGRWERLEHVVDGLLDSEERFKDISGVRLSLIECRFHGVGVAREGLGDSCQAGVNSAGWNHHFLPWVGGAGELFLEVAAEGFLRGLVLYNPLIGFPQCCLAGGEDPGLQSTECCHVGDVTCLRHCLWFRGVTVLGGR